MKRTKTWLALRTAAGELEPLQAIDADALRRLVIQAHLLQVSLQDWLETILDVAARLEPCEEMQAEVDSLRMIEIPVSDEVRAALHRQRAKYFAMDFQEIVVERLAAASDPGDVLKTLKVAEHLDAPAAALLLLGEGQARVEIPFEQQNSLAAKEARELACLEQEGAFKDALAAAGLLVA